MSQLTHFRATFTDAATKRRRIALGPITAAHLATIYRFAGEVVTRRNAQDVRFDEVKTPPPAFEGWPVARICAWQAETLAMGLGVCPIAFHAEPLTVDQFEDLAAADPSALILGTPPRPKPRPEVEVNPITSKPKPPARRTAR